MTLNHHEPPRSLIQNEIWYWILDSDWLNSGSHDIFLIILEKNYHEPLQTTTNHHEPPWTTTNHYEPLRTTTNHHKPLRTTTNYHEPPWTTTNHYELLQNITNHHETSRIIINHHKTSQTITNHHEPPQKITKHLKLPGNILNHHKPPWNITNYHKSSPIIMKHRKLSWNIMNHHGPPQNIMNHPMFWLKLHVSVNISVNSRQICTKPSLSRINSKWSYWFKESNWRRIFAVPLNQFSQLLKMMKIYTFLTLILYITVQNENIIPTNMCYDKIDIFIQNLQEIGASTLSKM